MHDDQHRYCYYLQCRFGKCPAGGRKQRKLRDVKIVVNYAGASAVSCTKLYVSLGARLENIVMVDSKGVTQQDPYRSERTKRYFATDRADIHTLAEAIKGGRIPRSPSKGNVVQSRYGTQHDSDLYRICTGQPDPEISPYEGRHGSPSGRTDGYRTFGLSNEINNVIGFPYIFRGALDTKPKPLANKK